MGSPAIIYEDCDGQTFLGGNHGVRDDHRFAKVPGLLHPLFHFLAGDAVDDGGKFECWRIRKYLHPGWR
ncbi:hypothetical protein GCM10011591_15240 [Nocardia camponoti]|uniref:Uncharacterized protein n=1 Tax=Nocardia camponoti TaxID=1616106 RepID=A0A917QD63_9NOCA|nr:hypothetical protein GCM10011591_15240 [Nocardia camponoti]